MLPRNWQGIDGYQESAILGKASASGPVRARTPRPTAEDVREPVTAVLS